MFVKVVDKMGNKVHDKVHVKVHDKLDDKVLDKVPGKVLGDILTSISSNICGSTAGSVVLWLIKCLNSAWKSARCLYSAWKSARWWLECKIWYKIECKIADLLSIACQILVACFTKNTLKKFSTFFCKVQ